MKYGQWYSIYESTQNTKCNQHLWKSNSQLVASWWKAKHEERLQQGTKTTDTIVFDVDAWVKKYTNQLQLLYWRMSKQIRDKWDAIVKNAIWEDRELVFLDWRNSVLL